MDEDNDDDTTSLSSFISIGTAEMKPMTPMNPTPLPPENENEGRIYPFPATTETATGIATTATMKQDPTLAELIDMHRHRLPPLSVVSSRSPSPEVERRLQREQSEQSLDTMGHLKEKRRESEIEIEIEHENDTTKETIIENQNEHAHETDTEAQNNRRSIIAPSTVKVSLLGTMSEPGVAALPLEEGLQKLYRLYQDTSPPPPPLPRNLSITEVPLTAISNTLSSHILSLQTTISENLFTIENLHQTNAQTRQELINLEFQYCLARQEANMSAMSADELRLRIEWQAQEIRRVNAEKEGAISQGLGWQREVERLRGCLVEMTSNQAVAQETVEVERVKGDNQRLKDREETLLSRIEDLEAELWESKKGLERARFALGSVPGPMRRLCFRMLVAKGGGSGMGYLVENEADGDKSVSVDGHGDKNEEKEVEKELGLEQERQRQKQTGHERRKQRRRRHDKENGLPSDLKQEHRRSRSFF